MQAKIVRQSRERVYKLLPRDIQFCVRMIEKYGEDYEVCTIGDFCPHGAFNTCFVLAGVIKGYNESFEKSIQNKVCLFFWCCDSRDILAQLLFEALGFITFWLKYFFEMVIPG